MERSAGQTYIYIYICIYIYIYIYVHSKKAKYDASAILPGVWSWSIKAGQMDKHVRFGLTSNRDDGEGYSSGKFVGLFPGGRLYIPGGTDSTYKDWGSTNRVVSNRVGSKGPLYPSKAKIIILLVF